MSSDRSRRDFLRAAILTPSVSAVLSRFASQSVAVHSPQASGPVLTPTKDRSTGLPLLSLPPDFQYLSFGWTGDTLTDGLVTPPEHDGMAVIGQKGDVLTLCRNHEIHGERTFGPDAVTYDRFAGGGCTNLEFNLKTESLQKSWASLCGTVKNCAGGPTPWGTWLSCEETVLGPGDTDDGQKVPYSQTHGWVFDVPVDRPAEAKPLKAMGRFVHEAVAVDPRDGIIYETEDRDTAGFYRFLPNSPGKLQEGGRLQMLRAEGGPDLRTGCQGRGPFHVTWVDIDDPERAHSPGTQDELGVYSQGKAQGGTTFNRVEGCWYGDEVIYFSSTEGGDQGLGQVFAFSPDNQTLRLVYESPSKEKLANPDNLTVSPRGGLVLCEDADDRPLRMHALSTDGQLVSIAENNVVLNGERNSFKGDFRGSEWAGVCFSPDGKWLFANVQTPGITVAITGPWEDYGI